MVGIDGRIVFPLQMEIVRRCIDQHSRSLEEDFDKEFLFWEGNYWDEPVHDCSQLSFSTVKVLVDKIAVVFEKYAPRQGETTVLLFLPQVIQLPLSILAGAKAGVTDPANCDDEKLKKVLEGAKPVLGITVDAYWLGQDLQKPYARLRSVLEATSPFPVLVVRHTSPNPGVPPPEEHIPARRPYYLIEWDVEEGRDVEWSQEIRKVANDSKPKGREQSGPLLLLPSRDGSQLEPLGEQEIIEKIDAFPRLPEGPVLCLVHSETSLGVISLLSAWSLGLAVVQYEGLLNYPDPARIAHIVRKYEAKSMVLCQMDLDLEYVLFVSTKCLEIVVGPQEMEDCVQEGFAHVKFVPVDL